MRVAQDEQLRARFLQLALETFEVHGVAAVFVAQRARDHFAAVVLDHQAERVVHGRLDDHGVARLRERVHGHGQGEHHARRHDEPLALGAPAVAALEPVLHRLVVAIRCHGVAVHAVLHALGQRLDGGRRGFEVHVGNPKRQVIGRVAAAAPRVPLQATRVAAIDDGFEIIFRHATTPSSSCCKTRCTTPRFDGEQRVSERIPARPTTLTCKNASAPPLLRSQRLAAPCCCTSTLYTSPVTPAPAPSRPAGHRCPRCPPTNAAGDRRCPACPGWASGWTRASAPTDT